MTLIQRMIMAAALLVTPAQAATSDPEIIIYRFPGVFDNNGGINAGVATSFHCSNFSGALENVRVVVRDGAGALRSNMSFALGHLQTATFSTHPTTLYEEAVVLTTGLVAQGTAAIAATSVNVVCNAVTFDASATLPNGFSLRGIRFNPAPGSEE